VQVHGDFELAGAAEGRDAARQFLEDNPEVADEIEAKIKLKMLPPKVVKEESENGVEKVKA
jgi:hypothetical protein